MSPRAALCAFALTLGFFAQQAPAVAQEDEPLFQKTLNVAPPHISTDPSVRYDYDIVYVRGPRAGDKVHKRFYTDIATPVTLEPGADLMLLHPDGSEELLVAGGEGAITDPVISFDGEWAIYTKIHTMQGAHAWQPPLQGADIYKLNLKTREIVQLTKQEFTPNTGAADWSSDCRKPEEGKTHLSYGVLNFGAYPLPGGRIIFTSNRNAFRPPRGYPQIALQLFVMDDDGSNVEQIGFLNIAGALHPVTLTDGRVIFSSLESQGVRSDILWGIWSIHPDGTNWGPVVSAFDPGGAPNAFHFQSQLSDGSLIIEEYYNQNNSGFGAYIKLPLTPPEGYPAFGPAHMYDVRNAPLRFGRFDNGKGKYYRLPFMPTGALSLTPFALNGEGPADPSVLKDPNSPKVGKFTHPSGAPDNHLLTVWSPGPVNHQYTYLPQLDGGIYLIKNGQVIDEPGDMLLIKDDPNYNEQWPRAVVPYRRIYAIDEPRMIPPLANDGRLSPHLPEGTPFGLVGTSSLYKRESYPNGVVPSGSVTATYSGRGDPTGYRDLDPFNTSENGASLNWFNQGADAGIYSNDDIHAVRLLAMEPTTDRNRGPKSGRLFWSHARERLRILGEIPVRKFAAAGRTVASNGESGGSAADAEQPLDPDGNPDTSFLAKIPADTAFTFQTLDRDGMVLNMAQTWHQLRPGEIRNNCGGCHAHSQQPTPFESTLAAKPNYKVWDLVNQTPLLTDKARDESGQRWDTQNKAGLRRVSTGIVNVEYFRDVQPIFKRSCAACHTSRNGAQPSARLDLDADAESIQHHHEGRFPGTFYRLAQDDEARFGYKPVIHNGTWRNQCASRYVRKFQSRRSLLVWKIYGRRTDGWTNDDFPSPAPDRLDDPNSLQIAGTPVPNTQHNRDRSDLDFVGQIMPPPEAVAGTYVGPGGQTIKVDPLTDEDRKTIVRWIDLGCPIDLDYDPAHPDHRRYGWACDDNRPILALALPKAGKNAAFDRILIGVHDYYSGLEMDSFSVTADFAIDGALPGTNLARKFVNKSQGVWELRLAQPIARLPRGVLTVSIKDRQGNIAKQQRAFSVGW
jgi:hypothetical protein